jgi:hypothetical protein
MAPPGKARRQTLTLLEGANGTRSGYERKPFSSLTVPTLALGL